MLSVITMKSVSGEKHTQDQMAGVCTCLVYLLEVVLKAHFEEVIELFSA